VYDFGTLTEHNMYHFGTSTSVHCRAFMTDVLSALTNSSLFISGYDHFSYTRKPIYDENNDH